MPRGVTLEVRPWRRRVYFVEAPASDLLELVLLRAGWFVDAALDLEPSPSIPKLEDHHRPHVLKLYA